MRTVIGYLLILMLAGPTVAMDDELGRRASWNQPSLLEAKATLDTWLDDLKLEDALVAQIDEIWSGLEESSDSAGVLERTAQTIALAMPEARPLIELCQSVETTETNSHVVLLNSAEMPRLVRNHLRLLYGCWLVEQRMFDESLEQLGDLEPKDVVDPATLLFFQSVAAHRLIDSERCLSTLQRLLEREATLPRRYVELAKLMRVDLKPFKKDSLDEIARMMRNVENRLDLGRAGKRVRQEEEDVIAKLDKLIEKMEEAEADANQGAGGSGGAKQPPGAPLPDSIPAGGSGPGNVDPRKLGNKSGWGNLPAKARQEALQQISREFPSHYRDAIEQYFKRIAQEDGG